MSVGSVLKDCRVTVYGPLVHWALLIGGMNAWEVPIFPPPKSPKIGEL
ncbi:hypothetical protein ACKFKG_14710 [Phormidesmis sp. 146-35]